MTGRTHRVYAICFAYIATMLFSIKGLTEVNYYFSLIIMLAMSKQGAIFPDLDNSWESVPNKNVPNKIINTLIHMTGGKHRSWQTHSIDICMWFTIASYIIPRKLCDIGKISQVNMEVASLILLGFASGWISHLFSDMLNGVGVRTFCWTSKLKAKFVPKKIGRLRFNTGGAWEDFNFRAVSRINKVLGFTCLVFPLLVRRETLEVVIHLLE